VQEDPVLVCRVGEGVEDDLGDEAVGSEAEFATQTAPLLHGAVAVI
jgi:hypothetical protein